jgi:hypothetical protein
MNYLQIRNWEKHQQCDRNAPWIKLYTSLNQNYEFLNQSNSNKAAFVCLLLYAGANGNKIPNDGKFLASIYCMDDDIDIQHFINIGLLEEFNKNEFDSYINNRLNNIEKRKEADRQKKKNKYQKKESLNQNPESLNQITQLSERPETETEKEKEADKERKEESIVGVADASPTTTKKLGTRFTHLEIGDDWKEFCMKTRPDLDPQEVFSQFSDYWTAVPGQKGLKLDWTATWRNWIRTQKKGAQNVNSNNRTNTTQHAGNGGKPTQADIAQRARNEAYERAQLEYERDKAAQASTGAIGYVEGAGS